MFSITNFYSYIMSLFNSNYSVQIINNMLCISLSMPMIALFAYHHFNVESIIGIGIFRWNCYV